MSTTKDEGSRTLIQRLDKKVSENLTTSTSSVAASLLGYRDIDIQYVNASSIKILAGSICRDVTSVTTMSTTVDITIDLTVSGAGGLDTGTEAIGWYYVYMISNTSGNVSGVMSAVDESTTGTITMPSGYTYKRQAPIAICNSISGATTDGDNTVYYSGTEAPAYSASIVPFIYNPKNNKMTYTGIYFDTIDFTTMTAVANTFIGTAKQDNLSLNVSKLSVASFVPPISKVFSFFGTPYTVNNGHSYRTYSGDGSGDVLFRRYFGTIMEAFMDVPIGDYKDIYFVRTNGVNAYLTACVMDYTVTKRIP